MKARVDHGRRLAERSMVSALAHLRTRLVAPGLVSDTEVDRILELSYDPNWAAYSPIIVGALGRRSA
jgi:hypothetical protein